MAVPTVMSDLSTTAASNPPAGSESPTAGDDFLRAIQAIVRTTNAKGADIASATSTAIGAATGEFIDVTGTTTITSFDTIAAGIVRTVRFTGALTLTHNATSLILPGAANITTAANDTAVFRSLGSGNWQCIQYKKQDGSSIITGAPFVDSTAIIKGSADATKLWRVEVDGFTTATTRVATPPDKDITLAGLVDIRSYLAGCTMSTAGSSTTMSIAAGQCMDSTNAFSMTLAAIAKTTSAWAVGTAQGGLDTGTIANSTTYHFFVIRRPDTGVVDVLISLSATSPTLPTNYTQFRRIGSGRTNGSAQWVGFTQDGDYFILSTPVLDIGTTNPGTSAVTATLTSIPTGINVEAIVNANLIDTAAGGYLAYLSDLATTDIAVSATAAPLMQISTQAANLYGAWGGRIRTNTSAQIRYRLNASAATTSIRICSMGWIDTRGRNA